jgi:hypothetical protein
MVVSINISDALTVLQDISEDRIKTTDHSNKRLSERSIDKELIIECLINHEIKGILEQKEDDKSDNKYKIFYEHPTLKNRDLIIVIAIAQKKNIRIITTYFQKKDRRIRK